jgi:hypothetical protein
VSVNYTVIAVRETRKSPRGFLCGAGFGGVLRPSVCDGGPKPTVFPASNPRSAPKVSTGFRGGEMTSYPLVAGIIGGLTEVSSG